MTFRTDAVKTENPAASFPTRPERTSSGEKVKIEAIEVGFVVDGAISPVPM